MRRRELLAGAGALAAVGAAQGVRRRPNIIVVLGDDMGYRDLGCTGAEENRTPHIDRLAREGTRFSQWYSNAPLCAPARGALLTGRYPRRNGVADNGTALRESERTLPQLLRESGYATGLVGKWHLGGEAREGLKRQGFDRFFGFRSGCIDYYSHRYYWGEPGRVNYHDLWRDGEEVFEDGSYFPEMMTREAVRFIDENRARPFFLYFASNVPHYPMHAPERYMKRFEGLSWEARVRAAMMAALDDGVGAMVEALRRRGLERDSVIFFTGDNGATREPRAGLNGKPPVTGGNEPFRGFKFSLFDGGMHVPAVAWAPGRIGAGKVNAAPGSHLDLLPTLCRAAGVEGPKDRTLDGGDRWAEWTGGSEGGERALFWMHAGQKAVRLGRWKLVLNGRYYEYAVSGNPALAGEDAVFLSDLESDPGERKNLRRARPELVDELSRRLAEWEAGVGKN